MMILMKNKHEFIAKKIGRFLSLATKEEAEEYEVAINTKATYNAKEHDDGKYWIYKGDFCLQGIGSFETKAVAEKYVAALNDTAASM